MQTHGELAVQYIRSLVAGQGRPMAASAFAAGKGPSWDRAAAIHKAIVTAHGASEADDVRRVLGADIRAALRPLTILGRLQGLRRTSFDVRLITTTAGTTGAWAARGNAIPVARMSFTDGGTLAQTKVAAIVGVDEELAKSSSPDASSIISRDVISALAHAEDRSFADYLNAGVANEEPAGVAYGSTATLIAGTTVSAWDTALKACVDTLIDGGSDLTYAAWICSAKVARTLASLRDGHLAYPGVKVRGVGELMGMPQIASGAVEQVGSPLEHFMLLVDCSQVWVAESDTVEIDFARHTSVQMADNPTNSSSTGTATTQVSMFAAHTTAIRAVRYANWAPTSSAACAVLRGITI